LDQIWANIRNNLSPGLYSHATPNGLKKKSTQEGGREPNKKKTVQESAWDPSGDRLKKKQSAQEGVRGRIRREQSKRAHGIL